MPEPKAGESKQEYVSRCIRIVMGEGKSRSQALGKCYGMWESAHGKSGDSVRDEVPAVAEAIQRRMGSEPQAEQVREAMEAGSGGLDKRLVKVVSFNGEPVKVFTVNGEFVRKPKEAGGLGCTNFTMGMNGWAATDPMYRAEEWCLEDEVCLHALLPRVSFIATLAHELFERWVMKNLGASYEDAHEYVANPAEESIRRVLAGRPGGAMLRDAVAAFLIVSDGGVV